jgi:hypothetical protein
MTHPCEEAAMSTPEAKIGDLPPRPSTPTTRWPGRRSKMWFHMMARKPITDQRVNP